MGVLKVNTIQLENGNAPTAADLGFAAGSVLQVVQERNETSVTVSSDSLADTGISISITPTSADSDISIEFMMHYAISANASGMRFGIYRSIGGGSDTVLIDHGQDYALYFRADSASNQTFRGFAPIKHLDSPNTTSTVTYKLYADKHTSNGAINNGGKSFLTLTEIAG